MFQKIDHIAIAVRDIELATHGLVEKYDLVATGQDTVGDTKVCFFSIGDTCLELVQSVKKDGEIATYIDEKGEGLHHIAFEVEDVKSSLQKITDRSGQGIDIEPRKGSNDTLIAFLDSKDNYGMRIELVEHPPK